MSLLSKLFRAYFKAIQYGIQIFGGFIYFLIYLLSLFFKPLKIVIIDYKEGKLVYSTFLMTFISTSFFLLILLIPFCIHSGIAFKDSLIIFLISFLFVSPLVFLSLESFATFRKYRIK